MGAGSGQFMRNSDAFTWEMEHDAALRSTVVSVFLLDRTPDWDVLVERFDRIARTLPSFRQRVVTSLPPAPPHWEVDPDFDLGYHLRRVTAPKPGDLSGLLEMARRAEMADFDRARPLWEVTLVEGLDDPSTPARTALLCKLHHALTDGVGGVEIALALFDLERTPADRGAMPEAPLAPTPPLFDALRGAAAYDAGVVSSTIGSVLRHGPALAVQAVRRPLRTARDGAELAASVYRTVRPINRTGSELMRERRLVRRLGVHEVPMHRLREAAHAADGSLNDAFMAGVTGGLRLYHEVHGAEVGDLHVTMPVNLRADGDPIGGNRITLMRFDVPVGEPDPATRIRRIHEKTGSVRHERSLPYTQLIAGGLNLLPRRYIASILRNVDFLASDVPGIPVPVFIGGAAVLMQYAFGPTIGAGVNVTLMTYVDTCALGINADTGAIPDFEEFQRCLVKGFEEVLALAPEVHEDPSS